MIPHATLDLRDYQIETVVELENIVKGSAEAIQQEGLAVSAVVISDHQQKLLRLERYMQGEPLGIVKTQWITRVNGFEVVVAPAGMHVLCPACGGIHDDNQPWYARG